MIINYHTDFPVRKCLLLIKYNFLDYLLENDYDVFLTDYRLSPTNPACNEQQTLDSIKLDHSVA